MALLLGWAGPAVPDHLLAVTGERATLCLRSDSAAVALEVELARTPAERAAGLSGRATLAPRAGMLFLYRRSRPPDSGFWMYRTRIPLDIAYLGPHGEIRAIRHMQPCPDGAAGACPVYRAGVPYRAALEVNGGLFRRHGVDVGDRVVVSPGGCRK